MSPLPDMTIIALSGKLASGKTSLAQRLVELDPRYIIKSLATPIKHLVDDWAGEPPTIFTKPLYRKSYQAIGELLRAVQGPDFFVDLLLEDVWNSLARYEQAHFIIDDVRYPNELARIAGQEGIHLVAVRLQVSPWEQMRRVWEATGAPPESGLLTHHSETSFDSPDTWRYFDSVQSRDLPPHVALDQTLHALSSLGVDFTLPDYADEETAA